MNGRAVLAVVRDVFEEDRQAGDVIEVRMRQKNVPNSRLLGRRAVKAETTRVESDGIADQKGRQVLPRRRRQCGRDQHHPHARRSGASMRV